MIRVTGFAGRAAAASAAALAAAGLAFVLTAGSDGAVQDDPQAARQTLQALSSPSPSAPAAGTGPVRQISSRDARLGAGDDVPPPAQPPVRLVVPALAASMPVEATALDDRGFMALPESPAVAGWYRYSPQPGSDTGATVIAAHVDTRSYGKGPLARLDRLVEGDAIEVSTGATRYRYEVVSVVRLDKAEVDLDELFSRSGGERLHLITCGGEFDAEQRRYEDNVIAVATRVPGS